MAGISLNQNVNALMAQRSLRTADSAWQKSIERLSSGMRINRTSDDAAGVAISSSLQASSRVYGQASRNINDGISALNVSQGALQELSSITMRLSELAQQNANGTFSSAQRATGNTEFQSLSDEFNRLVDSTTFNGISLLNMSVNDIRIQAGFGTDGSISSRLNGSLSHARGLGTFGTASKPVAASTYGTATGDFNGDGISDLISIASAGGTITVQLGNSNGTLTTSQSFVVAVGSSRDLAIADFNGDGILDFAVNIGGATAHIRNGNGDGTFTTSGTSISLNSTGPLVAADFDNDGRIDLGGTSAGTSLTWTKNNGDGTWAAAVIIVGGAVVGSNFQVVDINGDGMNDIVGVAAGVVSILQGTGGGIFSTANSIAFAGAADVQVDDFNNDGKYDFAVTSSSSTNIGLYRGDGNFGFNSYATLTANAASARLLKGDMNGDGIDDLIALPSASSTGSFFAGNSDGSFNAALALNTGGGLRQGSLADLNNDGVLDLVGGSTTGVQLILQNTYQTTRIEVMNISTRDAARNALSCLETIRNRIAGELGIIGGFQSRLTSALNTVMETKLNYDQANSRIVDADIAAESANAARTSIIRRAASSILAQANQQPQLALMLLQ